MRTFEFKLESVMEVLGRIEATPTDSFVKFVQGKFQAVFAT